ncbi:hypothetical protein HGRIS_006368 [Hohenbuehelia grisea]|uniref:Uncharacterized protein n=1 Tax=Hohenbuehelia grisea TaxID=104357 RepID=A0ABR3K2N9_9AGAR
MPHFKELLKRSGNVPLALIVTIGDHRHHVLRALLKESARWQYLELTIMIGPSTSKTLDALNDCRGNFPILRTLDLYVPSSNSLPNSLSAFEDAPKLRTLVICATMVDKFLLPWSQIFNFRSPHVDRGQLFEALKKAPALQHIDLGGNKRACLSSSDLDDSLITLPEVRSIHIPSESSLDALHLPGLTGLSLEYRDFGSSMSSFVTRYANSLTTLEIDLLNRFPPPILPVLSALPHLERLEVYGPDQDNSAIKSLTVPSESARDPLLPRLQTLHLGFNIDVSDDLYDMLESRSPLSSRRCRETSIGIANLLSVYLGVRRSWGWTDILPKFRERVKAIQDSGMRIQIETGYVYNVSHKFASISSQQARRARYSHS